MEEYHHHSYSDESTPTTNYDFFQSLGSLNFNANTNANTNANASASPKLSARNSYAGDMSYDFSDVFGGPPKYMAFRQSPKQSGKYAATSLFESTSGISRHRLLDETPAFGYVRKTGINDDFYCDIFNGEAASVTSEASIASRPISRTLSPAQSPAGRIPEFKVFGVGSPLPKSRSSGTGCKESEYFPSGTSMQTYANICLSEDVQVYPSYQSSLHCRSPDIPRIHFGDPNRTVKTAQGALHGQDPGKLQLKSPNARVQPLFEPAESVLDIPPRLSSEKLCSTPRTASCADTSDDGWETSTGRLNKVPIHSLTKRRHSSDKAKAGESFEKMNSGFEKARLSASDVPFAEHQRLLILSPPEGSTVQSKLKSWRDWMNEAKGLNLRHESGSLSVSSSGVSSAKEIHANSEIPTAQVVANEMIGLERRRDSEASDDLGSYVIEIDAEKGETFGFLPVKEIQIDTSEHPHLSAGEESGESANDRSLQKTMADNIKADKLKSYKEKQSISYQRGGKTSRYGKEASSKVLNRQPSSELSPGYGSIPTTEFVCNKIAIEQKSFSATSPVATKENPLNESHRTSVGDPYSLDIPNMVKEVAERIEKWQCEKPAFFHEIPLSTAAKDKSSSSGKIDRKAGKDNREHIKKFELGIGRHKGNDRSMKLSKEKHGKTQEEGQPIDKDTQKTIEVMDAEIKQWANGKDGNLRALLSTLQYILWPECGWQPIPLIEIIEGVAVKKAYQKARLCLHPDKLQQKRATEQQKYIAKRVFHILQEAWTTFKSLDPF